MPPVIAPIDTFKVEYYFQAGQYGWSELWWYHDPVAIEVAYNQASALADFRIKLLAAGCALVEWMVSKQGLFRDSRQSPVIGRSGGPCKKMEAENPYTALLVRQSTSSRYRRNLYLRGIPKGINIQPEEGDEVSPVFFQQLTALQGYLLGNGGKFSLQSVTKEPGELGQPVTGFIQGAGAFVGYTAVTPLVAGSAPGKNIRLRQVRFANNFNVPKSGVYKCVGVDGISTVLATPWLGVNSYLGGATARVEEELHYTGRINLTSLRLVRRKAGVVHLQTKGKKKAKA